MPKRKADGLDESSSLASRKKCPKPVTIFDHRRDNPNLFTTPGSPLTGNFEMARRDEADNVEGPSFDSDTDYGADDLVSGHESEIERQVTEVRSKHPQ